MGITRGAVTHYLAGRCVPPLRQFQKLASVLKADPAWLQFGTISKADTNRKTEKTVNQTTRYHPIPILTWEQASQRLDVSRTDQKNLKDAITNFYTDQPRWYALRIKSDSMTSVVGGKSFQHGDLIIVDPDANPGHGDFVIAIEGKAKEAMFRQFVSDAGIKYLKPLNPQYPTTRYEKGTAIIAVVRKQIS